MWESIGVSTQLVTNIGQLVTNDQTLGDGTLLGVIDNAAVVIDDGKVGWVGPAKNAPDADTQFDAEGKCVIPGFVDSHTHAIFAGDRCDEFAARMTGEAYDGGGIATTMKATRAATDDELRDNATRVLGELRAQGTTTIEIKSGYGLDVDNEARLLRIACEFTKETTYLGGHVVPPGMDRRAYVDLVTGDMLKACQSFAKWVDVFCEPASEHAFDGDESREILTAGMKAGLTPRVHASQMAAGPGVKLAVELGAASVDHCTHLTYGDVDALVGAAPKNGSRGTVATLLPGVEFSTRSQYPNARAMWDAGVTIALATDVNPGSCYSSSMPFMIALAVREMRLSPAEALWSATAGGALALRRDDIGNLSVGSEAHLTLLDAPSYIHLAYRPGVPIAYALD